MSASQVEAHLKANKKMSARATPDPQGLWYEAVSITDRYELPLHLLIGRDASTVRALIFYASGEELASNLQRVQQETGQTFEATD